MKEISGLMAEKMLSAAVCAERIAIVTHMKPDGDAMGSSTGLYHFLKENGCKNVKLILPSPCPSNVSFLIKEIPDTDIIVGETNINEASNAIQLSKLIFCLDCNAFNRTEILEPYLSDSTADKILIDHHLFPNTEAFNISFSETEISSTCELVFYILMKTSIIAEDASKLPINTAAALYTGMTTDTNNFNNSTYPSTLTMASHLIANGVDKDAIIEKVMHSYKENRLRLIGCLLKDKLTITPEGGACMVIDKQTMKDYDIEEGDTEGIVNIPLDIEKVRLSILLKEDNEKIRVSIRSKKGTSANKLATSFFNGGGHENASGGKIVFNSEIKTIKDAEKYTIEHIRNFLSKQ